MTCRWTWSARSLSAGDRPVRAVGGGPLRADPALAASVARTLVLSNFPDTVAPDVLEAVGLDPGAVLGGPTAGQADRA